MQQPVEMQVDEHEPLVERVAAIDVAKASGMVCTRMPHETVPGRRVTRVWQVKATTRALVELADHLRCQGIQRVVLESTSDYWRPFYYLLEAAGLTVWLVNAAQAKNVPGRPKTDKIDAVWLAKLAERSMVSPSLVPTEPDAAGAGSGPGPVRPGRGPGPGQAADREAARGRPDQDLLGAHRHPRGLRPGHDRGADRRAAQPEGPGRAGPGPGPGPQRAALEEALDGRFTDHHARLARLLLGQLDELTARIEEVTALLEAAITALTPPQADTDTPTGDGGDGGDDDGDRDRDRDGGGAPAQPAPGRYARAVERLCAIPGAGPDTVRAVIGEIGLDMSVFGTHRTIVLLGQGRSPHRAVRPQERAGPHRAGATPTSRPRWPRWPWAPRRPTPSWASATGG